MPPKGSLAREFEADPDLEFEYSLAAALGMLVADLRARIGCDEYNRWKVYWGRRAQDEQLEEMMRR
jgi:hypothetical protein